MKTSHRISILGREIQVKNSSSVDSVREVEAYLHERVTEVALSLPNADQHLIALLVLAFEKVSKVLGYPLFEGWGDRQDPVEIFESLSKNANMNEAGGGDLDTVVKIYL